MIKLHLGCGESRIDGFTNIDMRYLPSVDQVDNVKFLRRYKDNTVDLIYACHVLEHFSRWDYKAALQRWFDILKPGSKLRLAIPDFGSIVDYYHKSKDLRAVSGLLFGGQDYDGNFHHWCWDFEAIKKDLTNIGFKSIERYDWRTTEHADIDDFSQAYLPHMDKDHGTLMSLNIEGVK